MPSLKIEDLHQTVQNMAKHFLQLCQNEGLKVKIICTLRTIEEQNQLYAQGRSKPGKIVTKAPGGQSYHNYGLAFDCVPLINEKPAWNRLDLFKRMGDLARSVGLEWGGSWKDFPDYGHFQWTGGLTIKDLQAGKRPPA